MENDMMKQIQNTEAEVADRERTLRDKDNEILNINLQTEATWKQKEDEINQLKKQIEEMSSDFAEMLKQTLAKMQDRIEVANV